MTYTQDVDDLDITPKMAKVLKIFLEDPAQPRYGFEIMRLTSLASGSLYPMLARLERAGWLT
jgi:PadR family transcriptional regulator, regulatory protein PadR